MIFTDVRKKLLAYPLYRSLAIWYYNHVYAIPYKIQLLKANKRKFILFYPEKPFAMHIIYKICHVLGYRIITNPNENVSLVVNYEDTTFRTKYEVLDRLARNRTVINYRCRDISKQKVDKIFCDVFGYSAIINPLTYKGKCVKKSDVNAQHDGEIIDCPIEKVEKGFVYQIVINNQIDGKAIQDLRAPVMKDHIPFVYLKTRSLTDRFSNTNSAVTIGKTGDLFSEDEIKKIILFCKEIGLDYGELDILRNKDDGKLYIIDVNNTPAGPPNHLSKEEQKMALKTLSEEFQSAFLEKI